MRKRLIISCVVMSLFFQVIAQNEDKKVTREERFAQLLEQEAKEAADYYADADTAVYGIRYLFSYTFDKGHGRTYLEDRLVVVSPVSTVDMGYQPIGEVEWIKSNPKDGWDKRDPSLTYHLTPSFYFYYPKQKQLKRTYRVISDEFLMEDTVWTNNWEITNEEKSIGDFHCKKAVCEIGGRNWQVWFTDELPYVAAPSRLVGVPGVVLEASDENGDVKWEYRGKIACSHEKILFVKYPDTFSFIPVEKLPIIIRLYALTDNSYVQRSGVMEKSSRVLPKKISPSTGIDACIVTNPIYQGYTSY